MLDSVALLPMSLSNLAKGFSTRYEKEKPFFPYSFVTEKTLYYVGNTPGFEYFQTNKRDITLEEYLKIQNTNWNLKEENIKYLYSDLISLLQIIYEFSHHILDSHNIQVTECNGLLRV